MVFPDQFLFNTNRERLLKCFQILIWYLFHTSIWKASHRKSTETEGPFKKYVGVDWTNCPIRFPLLPVGNSLMPHIDAKMILNVCQQPVESCDESSVWLNSRQNRSDIGKSLSFKEELNSSSLAASTTSFASKDADWCGHILTGWKQFRLELDIYLDIRIQTWSLGILLFCKVTGTLYIV